MNTQEKTASHWPLIVGTYRLVCRKLPDGTLQGAPDVMGMMTYTKDFRNFNVVWKDSEGKFFSESSVANYKLTDTEYSEKNLYFMLNDQIHGKPLDYDLEEHSGKSAVSFDDGKILFKLPLHDEPSVTFEKDRFSAEKPGEFIDFWEKVE